MLVELQVDYLRDIPGVVTYHAAFGKDRTGELLSAQNVVLEPSLANGAFAVKSFEIRSAGSNPPNSEVGGG